jgi:hypothetical protein
MPGPIPSTQRTRPAVRDLLRTDRVVPVPVGAREQHGLGIARPADAWCRRAAATRGAVRGVEPPPGLPRYDQPERAGLGGDPQGGHRAAGGARFLARAPGQRVRRRGRCGGGFLGARAHGLPPPGASGARRRRRGGGGAGRGPGLRATGGLLRAGLRRAAARSAPRRRIPASAAWRTGNRPATARPAIPAPRPPPRGGCRAGRDTGGWADGAPGGRGGADYRRDDGARAGPRPALRPWGARATAAGRDAATGRRRGRAGGAVA